jgi:hypothetical protein
MRSGKPGVHKNPTIADMPAEDGVRRFNELPGDCHLMNKEYARDAPNYAASEEAGR